MAITRRQFVTTLSALAAAAGIGQADISKLTEAFAHGGAWGGGSSTWLTKPKVVWVHGAECTGCSTSLLGLFEDAFGSIDGSSGIIDPTTANVAAHQVDADGNLTVAKALDVVAGGAAGSTTLAALLNRNEATTHPWGHRTLHNTAVATALDPDGRANDGGAANLNGGLAVDIADVLIDFIDLQYHETVMTAGGDLAYQLLADHIADTTNQYVLVVEGAVQPKELGGYWNKTGVTPWCSIAKPDQDQLPALRTITVGGVVTTYHEMSFDDVVEGLAAKANCAAVVAIGQCAAYGGYPACKGPGLPNTAGQTGALGVYDFLYLRGYADTHCKKVINVPGCPTNPWWFVLTVVAWLVDATSITSKADFTGSTVLGVLQGGANKLAINPAAVDNDRRLKLVYDYPLHSGRCPRYGFYSLGIYAKQPGDPGCLALIGCKGPSTKSLCSRHGWNNAQPQNSKASLPSYSKQDVLDYSVAGFKTGSHCITAGAPCMGCTQKGYPDAFSPFVVNR